MINSRRRRSNLRRFFSQDFSSGTSCEICRCGITRFRLQSIYHERALYPNCSCRFLCIARRIFLRPAFAQNRHPRFQVMPPMRPIPAGAVDIPQTRPLTLLSKMVSGRTRSDRPSIDLTG